MKERRKLTKAQKWIQRKALYDAGYDQCESCGKWAPIGHIYYGGDVDLCGECFFALNGHENQENELEDYF